jgi:hypothetical protein
MNCIPNSGPNLKVTSKTTPSKNYSHNFCTLFFDEKIGQKSAKIVRVSTVFCLKVQVFSVLHLYIFGCFLNNKPCFGGAQYLG